MRRTGDDPRSAADRRTSSLAGLAATLALVVASLYLIDTLRAAATLQDCALSGRSACLALARN